MADIQIALPSMHPGQLYVHNHRRRFTLLDAGRRWRKTTYMLTEMVIAALEKRGEWIYGAPTYQQVMVPWRELHHANRSGHIQFNASRMEAVLPGGSLIHFVSLDDPDHARGFTADGIALDEYADIHPDAWPLVLSPMLADTGGWAIKGGTPKGRDHFYREFEAAKMGESPDHIAFHAPTRGVRIANDRIVLDLNGQPVYEQHPLENPYVPFSEIIKLYQQIPERHFRQEILAEFLLDGGGVFSGVDALLDPSYDIITQPSVGYARYCIGVDLAKKADYTVCCVFDLDAHRVVNLYRWNHESWPLVKAKVAYLASTFNNAMVWVDSTGVGDPIYDDLQRYGLRIQPYQFTERSRAQLLDHAILCTEQLLYRLPARSPQAQERMRPLLSEMKAMEYRESPSGRLRPDHPQGLHDDTVWALALSLWPMTGSGTMPAGVFESLTAAMPQGVVTFESLSQHDLRPGLGRRL